jgi:hypothetical protein
LIPEALNRDQAKAMFHIAQRVARREGNNNESHVIEHCDAGLSSQGSDGGLDFAVYLFTTKKKKKKLIGWKGRKKLDGGLRRLDKIRGPINIPFCIGREDSLRFLKISYDLLLRHRF